MKQSDSCFVRARHPKQKEQRRSQILEAAAILLARDGFEKVSLNGIARQAKIAKSNIYRYFESREDIYLQLLLDDWLEWLDKIEMALKPHAGCEDVELVVDIISQAVLDSPRMCQLISVVGSVLENNISDESLYQFKLESVKMGMRLTVVLAEALPQINQETLISTLQTIIALIAGLWPLGNPSKKVSDIMERPELSLIKLNFEQDFKKSLLLIMRGACFS